jgi:hypothetical protein
MREIDGVSAASRRTYLKPSKSLAKGRERVFRLGTRPLAVQICRPIDQNPNQLLAQNATMRLPGVAGIFPAAVLHKLDELRLSTANALG